MEKIARFPGGEKGTESCHVSGCHGFLVPVRDSREPRQLKPKEKQVQLKWALCFEKGAGSCYRALGS